MGFSGGGGSQTLPHTHDSNIANDGGALQFNNVTQGSMGAGDVTYSDGNHLQVLTYPAVPAGETLTAAAASTAPSWVSSGGAGAWTKAGSAISTTYVSELEVTGITPADVYQVIYYISDDAAATGNNCRPRLQRNGGGSSYNWALLDYNASNSGNDGASSHDSWALGKVSNKHSWQGVYYIFAYNGNFSNSYQDGTVISGQGMTTAWEGIQMFGQNDATTDITSIKFFMAMDSGTVIDCNGSLQVNTLTYS